MKKVLLIVGGVSVLGYGLYKYFKTQADLLSAFDYKIIGINIKKFSLTNIAMDLKIRFISKSKIEAKVNTIYLDLFLEGKNVGYIRETNPFIIPANGSSDISLYISVNPQFVLKNFTDILLGISKNKDIKFATKGFASIKSGFIGATVPIDYETSLKEYLKGIPVIA